MPQSTLPHLIPLSPSRPEAWFERGRDALMDVARLPRYLHRRVVRVPGSVSGYAKLWRSAMMLKDRSKWSSA